MPEFSQALSFTPASTDRHAGCRFKDLNWLTQVTLLKVTPTCSSGRGRTVSCLLLQRETLVALDSPRKGQLSSFFDDRAGVATPRTYRAWVVRVVDDVSSLVFSIVLEPLSTAQRTFLPQLSRDLMTCIVSLCRSDECSRPLRREHSTHCQYRIC